MFIADFHIHSKYSRATSRECVPEMLDLWARRKGIAVVGTGDFTHPGWRQELKEKLVPSGEGLYTLKDDLSIQEQIAGADFKPQFIVSGEISSIYKKNGKVRKIHNLILLPGLEEAESISSRLEAIGNLRSDGRPILGLDSRDLLEIVLDICPEAIFIPAHIWTPHFSLYGAFSGFDDISECFEDLTDCIYAVETGLSSDPPMNWRLSRLDNFTLVSNSDAHSPANLGREANIFDTELSYFAILKALKNRHTKEFRGTIEFFPEEGKYHYDGHRACKVCLKPAETKALEGRCPVCGGRITVGVLHRVEALADREEGIVPKAAKDFESLVPLCEVIASSIGSSVSSKKVKEKYAWLVQNLGTEFFILREAPLKDIELAAGAFVAEGIRRLRCGRVERQPGFDGEYGKIKIFDKNELEMLSGQLSLGRFEGDSLNEKQQCNFKKSAPKNPQNTAEAETETLEKANIPANKVQPAIPKDTTPAKDTSDAPREALISPSEILYGLNEKQWEAVSSPSQAIAVIAGPGTGKTKTLVSRIAYLVEKCAVHPSQITAVTFTNKAAAEMRLRLANHFGKEHTTAGMTIGTFHSICLEILNRWRGNNITVIDEYNALALIGEIIKELKVKISPKEAWRRISLLKNKALAHKERLSGATHAPELLRIYDLYCSRIKRFGVMDYDDIILEALRQFECRKSDIAGESPDNNSFSYLLVDEFQDINEVQYQLIKEWSQKSKSVFIIGDPDQSIYGFRGSDYRYFERFIEDFPSPHLIQLTQNYRSTPEIINCAKAVLLEKKGGNSSFSLQTIRENGPQVRLINTKDGFSEALFVAKEVNRMVGGIDMLDTQTLSASPKKGAATKHQRAFSEIAVLYRTNRQAEILEECLLKEGVPYTVAGKEDFLAEQPVRETIAFFRFLLNPKDLLSLLVCLQAKGLCLAEPKQKVLESITAKEQGENAGLLHKIMETVQPLLSEENAARNFIELLKKYEPLVKQKKPYEIIASWIKDNGLSGIKCMELLLNTSVMYEKMASFMQNIVLGQEGDVVRSGNKKYSLEAVSLMTMHSAKGLEFPVVFICGVNEGMIPLKSSDSHFHIDFDEERRLFYVAMTRAKDELILLTSRSPSSFILGIPKEQLIIESGNVSRQTDKYKQVSLWEI